MSPEKDEYLCVSANHATPTEKQWHQIFYDENVWQIGWMRSPNSFKGKEIQSWNVTVVDMRPKILLLLMFRYTNMKRRSNNAMHCNGSVKVTKVFYISFRHRKETLEYKRKEDQTMEKQWWWQMGGLFTQSRHSSHTLCSAALYQNMFRYICCSCYFHVTNIKHRKLLRNWQNVFVGHCHWPKGALNFTIWP